MSNAAVGAWSVLHKRPRAKLSGSNFSGVSKPDLNKVQFESYESFLQKDIFNDQRKDKGIHAAFKTVFLANHAGTVELSYRL